ncbi:hypothetical protein ACQ4PT_034507 [Festuca glaucescens]
MVNNSIGEFQISRQQPFLHSGSSNSISPKTIQNKELQGLSLNERLLGYKTPSKQCFVSFDLFDKDDVFHVDTVDNTVPKEVHSGGVPFHQQVEKPGYAELNDNTMAQASFQGLQGLQDSQELKQEQVVFANSFEHEFYKTIISIKPDSSLRIFEVNKVWVDHRTLSLSMSPGGWIHPYVMDCFGMLTNVAQLHQLKEGKRQENAILTHIVIKDITQILMDPLLNHSDQSLNMVFRFGIVGFRMENAGLVHIPCPFEKHWILIVANFIDNTFDVLNPNSSNEKFQTIVTTVIFNFKHLFKKNYPGCRFFNILDFKLRYIKVPKHNFRLTCYQFVKEYPVS